MLQIACLTSHPALTDAWTRAAAKFDLSWAKIVYVGSSLEERKQFVESLKDSDREFTMMVTDNIWFTEQPPKNICDPFYSDHRLLCVGGYDFINVPRWIEQMKNPQNYFPVIIRTRELYRFISETNSLTMITFDEMLIRQISSEYPNSYNGINCMTTVSLYNTGDYLDHNFKTKQIRIDNFMQSDKSIESVDEFEWEFKK